MQLVWQDRSGVMLRVHLQPGARRSEYVGVHGDALKIRVTAPAVDMKANKACVELVAGCVGVPVGDVELASGHRSRRKLLRIYGVSVQEVVTAFGLTD